ncbi:MAG: hypothetical protein AAF581_21450 [Planctomycetota bacterium]
MKPDLPEIRQATISQDDVDDLFRDVELLCTLRSVRVRGATDDRDAESSLQAARDSLRNAADAAVQLRYHFDSREWIDTLTSDGPTIQLTRIADAF